jgi:1,3-beta-glucanosyltransferase GAS5
MCAGGSSNAADPIADVNGCTRDVAEFKKLGINTVRVYTVDNSANHDQCMELLANAGIYLALDVNTPNYSLNRASETSIQISYNAAYLQSIFATIDAFAKYDNTLLFFSANEVINSNFTSFAAPYIKAVARDMKSYISSRGYRSIPVGYSAADVSWNRLQTAEYMNCGDTSIRSDFFAFNDYSWCDPSSFVQSGWNVKVEDFSNYSIPLFLSEYGCNTNTRKFEEVAALYNTEMTGVYSGGLVYEYSQEASNYGLVQINSDGTITELPDFDALESAYQNTSNPTGDGGYKASGTPSTCPPLSPPSWVVGTTLIPTMPAGANTYMSNGAGTPPGLNGPGSQNSGTTFAYNATTGGTAGTTSGATNSTSTGGKKSAAAAVKVPFGGIVGLLVVGLLSLVAL